MKLQLQLLITVFLIFCSFLYMQEMGIEVLYQPDDCSLVANNGDQLQMHYTGYIDEKSATGKKGSMFDSSVKRGRPLPFKLGVGQVIKGWDQGVLGMCVGEKRRLIIPPALGYGDRGAGATIPGGATLKFEVELVAVNSVKATGLKEPPTKSSSRRRASERNIFGEMDINNDWKISYEEMSDWFDKENKLMPQYHFEKQDTNYDQHISWDEFQGPKGPQQQDVSAVGE